MWTIMLSTLLPLDNVSLSCLIMWVQIETYNTVHNIHPPPPQILPNFFEFNSHLIRTRSLKLTAINCFLRGTQSQSTSFFCMQHTQMTLYPLFHALAYRQPWLARVTTWLEIWTWALLVIKQTLFCYATWEPIIQSLLMTYSINSVECFL